MPLFPVRRLVDFAVVAGDWFVVDRSIGANDTISILLSDRPHFNHRWPPPIGNSEWDDNGTVPSYRLLSSATTPKLEPIADIEIEPAIDLRSPRAPIWMSDNQWLVFDASTCARVINGRGDVIRIDDVGRPQRVHVMNDRNVWYPYRGEFDYWPPGPQQPDLCRRNAEGAITFRLTSSRLLHLMPPVHIIGAVTAISASEVWFLYHTLDEPPGREDRSWLVHLVDESISGFWPWSAVAEKAPISSWGRPFAVFATNVLVQGMDSSMYRDQDRLYLVSLDSQRSMELLPVDEHGEWIGEFDAREARGSILYLDTEQCLYAADMTQIGQR